MLVLKLSGIQSINLTLQLSKRPVVGKLADMYMLKFLAKQLNSMLV